MNSSFTCDRFFLDRDVPLQMWEQLNASAHANVLITRLLTNKPSFYFSNTARCFLTWLSPEYINQQITFVGLILLFFGLWFFIARNKYLFLVPILTAPLFPFLALLKNTQVELLILHGTFIFYVIFGILQVILWLKKKFF